MSLRPCLTCGRLTREGSYCRKHRPLRRILVRQSGGAQDAFRKRTLATTGGRCVVRGCATPWDRVEAHHPLALVDGGSHTQRGVPLCHFHHRVETQRQAAARKAALLARLSRARARRYVG